MVKLSCLAVALSCVLAACAHRPEPPAIALPDSTEVGDYVAAQWTIAYMPVFNRFADRAGKTATLVAVENVHCAHAFPSVVECVFDVTAAYDHERLTRRLSSQYERDGLGRLSAVVLVWHRLRQ